MERGFDWVDHNAQAMLAKQGDDGIIEGWHGDGNYTRTALLYALWKAQGARIRPWRADVSLGAVKKDDTLWISVHSQSLPFFPFGSWIEFFQP